MPEDRRLQVHKCLLLNMKLKELVDPHAFWWIGCAKTHSTAVDKYHMRSIHYYPIFRKCSSQLRFSKNGKNEGLEVLLPLQNGMSAGWFTESPNPALTPSNQEKKRSFWHDLRYSHPLIHGAKPLSRKLR